VVGVTKKHNYAVEVEIYDVFVRNAYVMKVEGIVIDLDILVEVVIGQVESRSFVCQNFKKSVEDIGVQDPR